MSLFGTLNIGKNALAVSQAQIQVTGNNISNAGNPNYSRQVARVTSSAATRYKQGVFIGNGVDFTSVTRQVDEALNARLRGATSDNAGASTHQEWLARVESVFNELTDDDLSSQLSGFFGAWSGLAGKTQDLAQRQVVLTNGASVAQRLNDFANQFQSLEGDVDLRLGGKVRDADSLIQQLADLNAEITVAEGGLAGEALSLRDQRDDILKQLSGLLDITTVQAGSAINVYVGSQPLVVDAVSRRIGLTQTIEDGKKQLAVSFMDNGGPVNPTGGELGGLAAARQSIRETQDRIDAVAGSLVFELNKLHSSGQALVGFSSVTGTYEVLDPAAALNSTNTGLPFQANNGSFVVQVRNKTTGQTVSSLINVDLDGIGTETTVNSLMSDLDGVANVSASLVAGKLSIRSDSPDVEITFSQDTSGALAVLGINTFFTGSAANDIALNAAIVNKPQMLAAARNGQPTDNQTALAIARLSETGVKSLGGATLSQSYDALITGVGAATASASVRAEASTVVLETLTAQREGLSGVSLDEEAVKLVAQQRSFQSAAQLISTIDDLLDIVINLGR